jgi:hypothetical protein
MRTVADQHFDFREIESEIAFMKQEIQFFLKLLSKQYAISINCCKVKLLDGYWKEFEKYKAKLEEVESVVKQNEHSFADASAVTGSDPDSLWVADGKNIYQEFYEVIKNIRTLKESFYAYMSESCQ